MEWLKLYGHDSQLLSEVIFILIVCCAFVFLYSKSFLISCISILLANPLEQCEELKTRILPVVQQYNIRLVNYRPNSLYPDYHQIVNFREIPIRTTCSICGDLTCLACFSTCGHRKQKSKKRYIGHRVGRKRPQHARRMRWEKVYC